jgi:inorganic pyrophosphatase
MENIVLEALIEIPMGSQNKYEVDKKTGKIKLDRVLYSPMSYPAEYGYIDDTLAEDGDPLDILVLVTNSTFPGCTIDSRVIGYMAMIDDGEIDHKLLAVSSHDPRFNHIKSLKDLSPHTLLEIEHFFAHYKDLQGNTTKINGWHDIDEAVKLINECFKRYQDTKYRK